MHISHRLPMSRNMWHFGAHFHLGPICIHFKRFSIHPDPSWNRTPFSHKRTEKWCTNCHRIIRSKWQIDSAGRTVIHICVHSASFVSSAAGIKHFNGRYGDSSVNSIIGHTGTAPDNSRLHMKAKRRHLILIPILWNSAVVNFVFIHYEYFWCKLVECCAIIRTVLTVCMQTMRTWTGIKFKYIPFILLICWDFHPDECKWKHLNNAKHHMKYMHWYACMHCAWFLFLKEHWIGIQVHPKCRLPAKRCK